MEYMDRDGQNMNALGADFRPEVEEHVADIQETDETMAKLTNPELELEGKFAEICRRRLANQKVDDATSRLEMAETKSEENYCDNRKGRNWAQSLAQCKALRWLK